MLPLDDLTIVLDGTKAVRGKGRKIRAKQAAEAQSKTDTLEMKPNDSFFSLKPKSTRHEMGIGVEDSGLSRTLMPKSNDRTPLSTNVV
jgi:hypothetical protein